MILRTKIWNMDKFATCEQAEAANAAHEVLTLQAAGNDIAVLLLSVGDACQLKIGAEISGEVNGKTSTLRFQSRE